MSRSIGKRPQKSPKITVVGEGITEQYYFRHIRSLYGFRYVLKPYYFGTTSLQEMDRKISEIISGGGIAVCIFDTDVSQRDEAERKKLMNLKRKYERKSNVIFCDSLPSVEYWFLLHYRNTNRHFGSSAEVEHELRTFIERYAKTTDFLENEKWVVAMCADQKLETAIQRAKDFGEENGSYSNVFKAFEEFMK